MKPIDLIPGFGPRREATRNDAGWIVTVTPPAWSGCDASNLQLNEDQYVRYLDWLLRGELIQNCLPDLHPDEREILMTGIGPEQFAALREDDDA